MKAAPILPVPEAPLIAPDAPRTPPAAPSTRRRLALAGSRQPLIVKGIAGVAIIVLAMRIVLPQQVEVGFAIAAVLMPLWLPAIRKFYGSRLLLVVGALAVVAGLWLARANAGDHAVDTAVVTSSTVLLTGAVLSIGLVLWARTLFSVPMVALLFGIGLILSISPSTALFSSNPYKFGFAIPLAVTGLALAKLSRRWWVEIIVIAALIGLSAANDARATFGLLLLAVILLVAQLPIFRAGHRGSAFLVSLGVVVASIVIYNVGQALILGGILGESTAARSLAQVDSSGSLVLGGRPELGATLALMAHRIWGFGAGIAPVSSEVDVAKAGMKAIGYDPNNGYVERYMFGGHIELHSVFGDLWAQAGIVGLAFVVIAAALLIYGVTRNIADGTGGAILLYLVAKALWDLTFSPFFSAERLLVLALGLAAVPIAERVRRSRIGVAGAERAASEAKAAETPDAQTRPGETGLDRAAGLEGVEAG